MANTKQNNPGLGINYEVHLAAYFALRLNTNPEIEDFKLQSNVEEFGNLDDLLIEIKTKSGENLYFAFQLKHKEKSNKDLLPTNFEARGDFNLEKYWEAFKKLNKENKKYHFILYTNKNFDSSCTSQVKNFCMKPLQDVYCFGKNFFDTSGDGSNLYKFEVKEETEDGKDVNKDDFQEFFSQFSLYTGQATIIDLEKSILNILKHKECYATYIDFFRRWHRGDFTNKILDKKTLTVHLLDMLLSSIANYYFSDGLDRNLIFFEAMVQQFDITIINDSEQNFIYQLEKNIHNYQQTISKDSEERMIQLAKDTKFIDRFTDELKDETKLKMLHYFYQKPLILDFQSSEDVIYEASRLCELQENGIKLVIMGKDIDVSKFSHLKIFTNLTEVDGYFLEETKRRCNLSLQGRNISFEEIFQDEIREFVTPREVFQMLKGNFSIGEDKEKLPECYIPRTFSATVFDIESIIKDSSTSVAIIFCYENKFEELEILIQNIVDREDYFCKYSLDAIIFRPTGFSKQLNKDIPIIILRKEKFSKSQLNEIHEEFGKKDVHLFKVVDEKRCLLLMSTKNISFKENYESTKISVEENNIHTFFNNSINILCAQPGMGKSTLMKYLKNECDSDYWTVMVDLKGHNHFLKRNHKIEDVLNYFLEVENCQDMFLLKTKKMFLEKRKIVLFLDGLDEVENECVDTVLNITKQLSEMGFRIWLSSRQNLKQRLEEYFNIFAIKIDEINENQQKKYIEERLTSEYTENEIEEIVMKIINNTDLVNNRQILEIPFQLHIITQNFLDDRSYYKNMSNNNFILTKMLEIFFEEKYKHYLANIKVENPHLLGKLEEQLENYEIVALHSVLDDEHFQKLQIKKKKLTQFKNWDFLGIITEINSEDKAVFEHLTYAEYFASKYLVKNSEKARILKEEIFTEKYQNLLLIFNTMLAEDSPLHLAIIYKDFDRIEEMEQSSLVDKAGRTFLQVVACVATRHPPLEYYLESSSLECLMKDKTVQHFKGENLRIKEVVNTIISSESFKNDKIFEWNSLDYALINGALYIVEAILEEYEKPPNFYKMLEEYYSDEVVAYYSIRFGYYRLLSEILGKNSCRVINILSDYLEGKGNNSILNLIFTSDCTNSTKIVELLTGDDINKTVYEEDEYNFFHFAVFHNNIEFVKFLLEKKADPNVKDKKGISPLLESVDQNNFEISKSLIENGADIDIKDMKGRSPLFFAVRRVNVEISRLLVERGADVNIKDKYGWSPLHWAVKRNSIKISKLLVENKANLNIQDKEGKSPLFVAVKQNNLKIAELLVKNGADVDIKDKDGKPLLFLAVEKKLFKISKYLIQKISVVNIKDKDDWSSCFSAVKQNNLEISKQFVKKGANVNIQNKDGCAAIQSNSEISTLLVEIGAEVNLKDKDGRSPLAISLCSTKQSRKLNKIVGRKKADIKI